MKLDDKDIQKITALLDNNTNALSFLSKNNLTGVVTLAKNNGWEFAAQMVQFFFKYIGLGQNIFRVLTIIPKGGFAGLSFGSGTFLIPSTVTAVEPEGLANTDMNELKYDPNCSVLPSNCFAGSTVKKIQIGEHVTEIASNAFSGCADLELVILPKSLKVIHKNAFDRCNEDVEIQIWDELLMNPEAHQFEIEDYNDQLEPDEKTDLTGDPATDFYNNAFNPYH